MKRPAPDQIADDARNHRNFTMIPNIVDELGLSPLAIALYFHYRRWEAADRKRAPGLRFLSGKYKVGPPKINAAKAELASHGLIRINSGNHKIGRADEVIVRDIWSRNSMFFKTVSSSPVHIDTQVGDTPMDGRAQVGPNLSTTTHTDPCTNVYTKKESNERTRSDITLEDPEKPDLIARTEEVLGVLLDLPTRDRILDVVPGELTAYWLDFLKDRMLGAARYDINQLRKDLGWWLTNFRENLWKYPRQRRAGGPGGSQRDEQANRGGVDFSHCSLCDDYGLIKVVVDGVAKNTKCDHRPVAALGPVDGVPAL